MTMHHPTYAALPATTPDDMATVLRAVACYRDDRPLNAEVHLGELDDRALPAALALLAAALDEIHSQRRATGAHK